MIKYIEKLAKRLKEIKTSSGGIKYEPIENILLPEDLPLNFLELNSNTKRFTLIGLDAASITLPTIYGEISVITGAIATLSGSVVYPRNPNMLQKGSPPFIGALDDAGVEWITSRYILLRIPYGMDPFLPEGAIAHDVRINLETYLMNEVIRLSTNSNNIVLLIDGPATYPFPHTGELSKWAAELGMLNKSRIDSMIQLSDKGIIPLCVVKRVWTSSYIQKAKNLGIKDIDYIAKILGYELKFDKPLLVGPWESRGRVGVPDRIMAYLIVPLGGYSKTYSLLRLELIREVAESLKISFNELALLVARELTEYSTYVPIVLQVADQLSKRLVKFYASLIETVLKQNGILLLYSGEII